MSTIKFSHTYFKMPFAPGAGVRALLVQVLRVKRADLAPEFIRYDTEYRAGDGGTEQYPLTAREYLLLLLVTNGRLWTTLRSWDKEKEKYYRGLVGEQFDIVVEA